VAGFGGFVGCSRVCMHACRSDVYGSADGRVESLCVGGCSCGAVSAFAHHHNYFLG